MKKILDSDKTRNTVCRRDGIRSRTKTVDFVDSGGAKQIPARRVAVGIVLALRRGSIYILTMGTFLFAVLMILGIGLMLYRPLARATGVSIYWEIGGGALFVVMFAIHLSVTYVSPAMYEDEIAKIPCEDNSPQGLCYSLQKSMCKLAWQTAETACRAQIAETLKSRPSALVGPLLNRCRAKHMDQALRYNRANTETAYCQDYFKFIEEK